MTPEALDTLTEICSSPNRRAAIARILSRNRVPYRYVCYAGSTVNIEVRFGDSDPEHVYGAHYDVWPGCPGANDNGASVVSLIQLAVRLTQVGFSGPLLLIFFDKEEPCFRSESVGGSNKFAENLRVREVRPDLVVVLDVVGFGDTMFYSRGTSEAMADRVRCVNPDLECRGTPGSDDVLLAEGGIESVLLCVLPWYEMESGYPKTWSTMHTEGDSLDTVDPETIEWVVQHLESLAQDLIPDGAAYVVPPMPVYDDPLEVWNTCDPLPF